MLLWVGRRVGACGLILRAPELFTTRPAWPCSPPWLPSGTEQGWLFLDEGDFT